MNAKGGSSYDDRYLFLDVITHPKVEDIVFLTLGFFVVALVWYMFKGPIGIISASMSCSMCAFCIATLQLYSFIYVASHFSKP